MSEVSLKEYINTKIEAVEKSITLVSNIINARLEHMNEFGINYGTKPIHS